MAASSTAVSNAIDEIDVTDGVVTDRYALYCGDCCEILRALPSASIHGVLYSPPFAGEGGALYEYSSSPRDLSNCRTYADFFAHYEFVVREIHRLLLPGRVVGVHCMDVPKDGANVCGYIDFPGDIIRLHERIGFDMLPRVCIWKEPLTVRNRTMAKSLAHRQIVDDATQTNVAGADYLLLFRKKGVNPIPVVHPNGLLQYFGEREIPRDLLHFRGWRGKQTENRFSHWIWRRYASSVWDDIRLDHVLPYKEARDPEDERHPHPLQRDVAGRFTDLYTNVGETILTPFGGVGSEIFDAVQMGRKGVLIELKRAYFIQAVRNMLSVDVPKSEQLPLDMSDPIDGADAAYDDEEAACASAAAA